MIPIKVGVTTSVSVAEKNREKKKLGSGKRSVDDSNIQWLLYC